MNQWGRYINVMQRFDAGLFTSATPPPPITDNRLIVAHLFRFRFDFPKVHYEFTEEKERALTSQRRDIVIWW